jgi:hypothetical protein
MLVIAVIIAASIVTTIVITVILINTIVIVIVRTIFMINIVLIIIGINITFIILISTFAIIIMMTVVTVSIALLMLSVLRARPSQWPLDLLTCVCVPSCFHLCLHVPWSSNVGLTVSTDGFVQS